MHKLKCVLMAIGGDDTSHGLCGVRQGMQIKKAAKSIGSHATYPELATRFLLRCGMSYVIRASISIVNSP